MENRLANLAIFTPITVLSYCCLSLIHHIYVHDIRHKVFHADLSASTENPNEGLVMIIKYAMHVDGRDRER